MVQCSRSFVTEDSSTLIGSYSSAASELTVVTRCRLIEAARLLKHSNTAQDSRSRQ
jgi:hypothetical protein